ncbi:hypothetical protein PLAN_70519 [Planktothrix rubescens CCAP 1459/22]|uniref:Uncharacterized protein n=1 Tax=Planktothrix rubescens CCAP 1459/22 TaxID=329571 RepID=A0A6J7ZTA3_PLARU|nr:hypothetical protein PLAN_70519 [Planktothrix rubescens NIVA-CYA 18]
MKETPRHKDTKRYNKGILNLNLVYQVKLLFITPPFPINDLRELRTLTQIKIREIREILLNP